MPELNRKVSTKNMVFPKMFSDNDDSLSVKLLSNNTHDSDDNNHDTTGLEETAGVGLETRYSANTTSPPNKEKVEKAKELPQPETAGLPPRPQTTDNKDKNTASMKTLLTQPSKHNLSNFDPQTIINMNYSLEKKGLNYTSLHF